MKLNSEKQVNCSRSWTNVKQTLGACLIWESRFSSTNTCYQRKGQNYFSAQANSTFHLSGVGKWVPASAGYSTFYGLVSRRKQILPKKSLKVAQKCCKKLLKS